MTSPRPEVTAEALVVHGPFLRTVAMGLLLDEHHAEDAVQDTMLRALEHAPERRDGLGPWLRTACRNLALNLRRSDGRRRRREAAVARPEAKVPARADLTEQLKAWVVEALVTMRDPYREALLLRYYEDLPPRAIAQQLDVPVTTVYSRLQKGLQRLREEIEKRRSESEIPIDRNELRLGLAALAGWPKVTPLPPPVMSSWQLGALAAVLVTAVTVGWWTLADGQEPEPHRVSEEATRSALPASAGDEGASLTEIRRVPADARASTFGPDTIADVIAVHGRAVDLRQHPVADAVVTAFRKGLPPQVVRTSSDGTFELVLPTAKRHTDEVGLHLATADGLAAARPLLVPAVAVPWLGTDRVDFGAITLAPANEVAVRIAASVRSEPLQARLVEHLPSGEIRPGLQEIYLGAHRVGEDGRVRLPLLPRGRVLLRTTARDGGQALCAMRCESTRTVDGVELQLLPALARRVRVEDVDGRAVPGMPLLLACRLRDGVLRTLDLDGGAASGSSGECVVILPPRAELVVAPGNRAAGSRSQVLASRQGRATLVVDAPRACSWPLPLALSDTHAADGANARFAAFPLVEGGLGPPLAGCIAAGRLSVEAVPGGAEHLLAWLPGGSRCKLEVGHAGRPVGEPTRSVAGRPPPHRSRVFPWRPANVSGWSPLAWWRRQMRTGSRSCMGSVPVRSISSRLRLRRSASNGGSRSV